MLNIPIYNALITSDSDGIFKISLVDAPAVESNWVAFNEEQQKKLSYSIEDEEERIIYGVIMRADYPIYRREGSFEYYITYSKETIKQMAEKLMVDGNYNNINLMHTDGTDVDGVNLLQLFIKDSEKGINPVGFEDISDGSLFAQYKVENDEIWEKVKDGTFLGFSLEGYFTVEKQNKEEKNNKTLMGKLKDMVAKILAQFGAVATDKGTLVWESEEDLKEGDIVTLEDGNQPEDGDYKTEDGKVITVEDGKVAKIADAEAEVAPEQEVEAESESKQRFNAIKAQFEASYQEVESNIYSALADAGSYGYLIENGDDYAIVSEWGQDEREHIYRYEISIAEDGYVTLGAKKEVKVEYVDIDEAEEEPEAQPEAEVEMAEEQPAEEPAQEEEEAKSEIDALKEEIEALKADIDAIKESIADIVEKPAVEPIAQEFEKVTEISTGNAKLDKVCRRVATLRK